MALSEITRFPLLSSLASEFLKLRSYLSNCGVKSQYFGYTISPSKNSALQIKKQEMCWVIQWPSQSDMHLNESFRSQLDGLAKGEETSLLFQFKETQIAELLKALEAPVCEFAIINLMPDAPQPNEDFKTSMHKTYTDCYLAKGFTGGEWAYAINTNDTNGQLIQYGENQLLPEQDRKLAVYCLGWESVELHRAYSVTPLFDEEIDKLKPWFGPGTGAWWAKFEKYV